MRPASAAVESTKSKTPASSSFNSAAENPNCALASSCCLSAHSYPTNSRYLGFSPSAQCLRSSLSNLPAKRVSRQKRCLVSKKRIGIFVIAYNAVNKLDWTLDRIPQEVWEKVDEVFLFDDCSTDNTYYAAIGYKHAKTVEKLTIHRNAKNLRYG